MTFKLISAGSVTPTITNPESPYPSRCLSGKPAIHNKTTHKTINTIDVLKFGWSKTQTVKNIVMKKLKNVHLG